MFYDATGSYNASFYISGSLILLSGLLGIPLRRLSQWEKKRNEMRNHITISLTCPDDANNAQTMTV